MPRIIIFSIKIVDWSRTRTPSNQNNGACASL